MFRSSTVFLVLNMVSHAGACQKTTVAYLRDVSGSLAKVTRLTNQDFVMKIWQGARSAIMCLCFPSGNLFNLLNETFSGFHY